MSILVDFLTPISLSSWNDFCSNRYEIKIGNYNRFIIKGIEFSFFKEQCCGITLLRIVDFDSNLTDVIEEILAITTKFPGKITASQQIHDMINDVNYRNAIIQNERSEKLEIGTPKLRAVCLDRNDENNPAYVKMPPGLNFDDVYLVLGEVSDTKHYVVMNLKTGKILPGMFHLSRFKEAHEDMI